MDHDETICPITLETFRDPVRAGDGRVYEREAITRWIIAHGTSPFTRQPLRLEDLREETYLKVLVSQRRCSTVSFDARHQRVILPPIRTCSPPGQVVVDPLPEMQTDVTVPSRRCSLDWICCVVNLCCQVSAAIAVLVVIFGMPKS